MADTLHNPLLIMDSTPHCSLSFSLDVYAILIVFL